MASRGARKTETNHHGMKDHDPRCPGRSLLTKTQTGRMDGARLRPARAPKQTSRPSSGMRLPRHEKRPQGRRNGVWRGGGGRKTYRCLLCRSLCRLMVYSRVTVSLFCRLSPIVQSGLSSYTPLASPHVSPVSSPPRLPRALRIDFG